MKLRIKNTKLTIQIISWLQIIGGINGFGLMGYLMLQTDVITGPHLLIFFIGVGLFSYSIYCGKRLLTDFKKEPGIILSLINHSLQLVQWAMLGYGFTYGTGAELAIGIKGFSLNINFLVFFSSFRMAINSDNEFYLKVNLMALLIILVLLDIFNEIKVSKEIKKLEVVAE